MAIPSVPKMRPLAERTADRRFEPELAFRFRERERSLGLEINEEVWGFRFEGLGWRVYELFGCPIWGM